MGNNKNIALNEIIIIIVIITVIIIIIITCNTNTRVAQQIQMESPVLSLFPKSQN